MAKITRRKVQAGKLKREEAISKKVAPAPVKKTEVKITAAKGRPMLTWVGKRPLSHVTAFPAQHIETFSPMGRFLPPPRKPLEQLA